MAITTDRTTRDDTRVEERVDGSRPVETRTEETRTTTDPYAGIAVARDRFGGIDIPASIVGMLTALSTTIILAGLVGAAFGAVNYQTGLEGDAKDIATWSMVGGIAVLFVAYLSAAGRQAAWPATTERGTASRQASGR